MSDARPSDADMRAFGASDAACYLWPDDNNEHKALRAAYIRGAADCGASTAQVTREDVLAEIDKLEKTHSQDEGGNVVHVGWRYRSREEIRDAVLSLLSAAPPLAAEAGNEWRDIASAPPDCGEVLLWWPECKLDDYGNLTDEVVGGTRVIGRRSGNSWEELGGLEGRGEWFGDESEPGHEPTLWQPLPAPPVIAEPGE